MPKEVAYKFGGGVLTEFHLQYCLEAERNLPLSGWMKDLDLPIGQAKSQLGFITFVVLPLWASMGTIFESLKTQVSALCRACNTIRNSLSILAATYNSYH